MRFLAAVVVVGIVIAACGGRAVDRFPVEGFVHAGPTCPIESDPPDPACADRPVPDAVLVVVDAAGGEVASLRTDPDGRFRVELPAGTFTIVPQPVEGLLGTPGDVSITVPVDGRIDIAYDTGIR